MKSRGVYETPGGTVLRAAHRARRVADARPRGHAPPRQPRPALRRDGLLRLLVRARARDAAGRDRRVAAARHRHGAAEALQGQRHSRRPEGAPRLALRSEARELRGGRRLPQADADRLHPPDRAPAPHPRAGRAAAKAKARERPPRADGEGGKRTRRGAAASDAAPRAIVEAFTASLGVDRRLYPYDIAGSIAHAEMLARVQAPRRGRRREDRRAASPRSRRSSTRGAFRFRRRRRGHPHGDRAPADAS